MKLIMRIVTVVCSLAVTAAHPQADPISSSSSSSSSSGTNDLVASLEKQTATVAALSSGTVASSLDASIVPQEILAALQANNLNWSLLKPSVQNSLLWVFGYTLVGPDGAAQPIPVYSLCTDDKSINSIVLSPKSFASTGCDTTLCEQGKYVKTTNEQCAAAYLDSTIRCAVDFQNVTTVQPHSGSFWAWKTPATSFDVLSSSLTSASFVPRLFQHTIVDNANVAMYQYAIHLTGQESSKPTECGADVPLELTIPCQVVIMETSTQYCRPKVDLNQVNTWLQTIQSGAPTSTPSSTATPAQQQAPQERPSQSNTSVNEAKSKTHDSSSGSTWIVVVAVVACGLVLAVAGIVAWSRRRTTCGKQLDEDAMGNGSQSRTFVILTPRSPGDNEDSPASMPEYSKTSLVVEDELIVNVGHTKDGGIQL